MDRKRSRRRFLSAAALAVAALTTAATELPLLAARWLPPDRQVQALLTVPTECLTLPANVDLAQRIAIGRAAFRTPLLLGGQGARAGLSCNSCHRNGRGNPDFHFPGLSGAPGTADVTSSLMSSQRGDRIDNPVAIPDLSAAPATLKVSKAVDDLALERFISGLIEAEFDGPKPSPLVLASVSDYVRALTPDACPAAASRPIRLADHLADARAAMQATLFAQAAADPAATRLMLASARTALGLIDERYAGADLAAARDAVRTADRELAAIQAAVDSGDGNLPVRITAWVASMPRWTKALAENESRSLFNAQRLAAAVD